MRIAVSYTPYFVKQLKRLPYNLREEAIEKIELFKDPKNHKMLRVHKLHGYLADQYSFSVNYHFRIVFEYLL